MKFLLLRTTKGIPIFIPNATDKAAPYPFSPPLDLLYLASGLETEAQYATVLDLSAEPDPQESLRRHLTGTDYAILRVPNGNHHAHESLADSIHNHDPSLPILLTGSYCQTRPGHALTQTPTATLSIDSEAEFHVKSLLAALTGAQPLNTTPGISYRDHNTIKHGPSTTPNTDLDSLPFPARHLVNSYSYGRFNGIYLSRPPFTSLVTSRGCPFHCRFCTTHVTSPAYRARSPDNVLAELL